jgi:hypothetical protein
MTAAILSAVTRVQICPGAGTEENGGLGLLALARNLAALPSRYHDMYFALVTGHFQLPQFSRTILNPAHPEVGQGAVSTWMLDHPHIYQSDGSGNAPGR